jgi:C1A family cysteine protease
VIGMATTRAARRRRTAEIEVPAIVVEEPIPAGMGWLPDFPDLRDYEPHSDEIEPLLAPLGLTNGLARAPAVPAKVDLRPWFSPVENQGSLGSCTANAGVGVVEYYERRAHGKHLDASRLFLYKATRNLLGWTGDTGAFLRTTMGALVLFGVPPEKYYPYLIAEYDKEPSAFCYAFAQSYQAINYFRLDPPVTPRDVLLGRIKSHLAAGSRRCSGSRSTRTGGR